MDMKRSQRQSTLTVEDTFDTPRECFLLVLSFRSLVSLKLMALVPRPCILRVLPCEVIIASDESHVTIQVSADQRKPYENYSSFIDLVFAIYDALLARQGIEEYFQQACVPYKFRKRCEWIRVCE